MESRTKVALIACVALVLSLLVICAGHQPSNNPISHAPEGAQKLA